MLCTYVLNCVVRKNDLIKITTLVPIPNYPIAHINLGLGYIQS